jgi:hypothetical protein
MQYSHPLHFSVLTKTRPRAGFGFTTIGWRDTVLLLSIKQGLYVLKTVLKTNPGESGPINCSHKTKYVTEQAGVADSL